MVGPLTYFCEILPRCLLVAGSLLYVVVPHGCEPSTSLLTPPSHAGQWPGPTTVIASHSPPWITDSHLSGPWKLPFLGFEAQSWPSNKTLLCVSFSSSSLAFTHCIIVYISCFSAVKFSEHSIQSCAYKPKAQVTCIGFMS